MMRPWPQIPASCCASSALPGRSFISCTAIAISCCEKLLPSVPGASLLPDPTVIDLYGTPTLLMHGDSLCIGDKAYQAFRQQARQRQWQDDMLLHSLAERRTLASTLRKVSNEATSNKAQDIVDVDPQEIERVVKTLDVTQLIHGHTHRPARHNLPWGQRWVLGDWDEKAWVVEASQANTELYKFDI